MDEPRPTSESVTRADEVQRWILPICIVSIALFLISLDPIIGAIRGYGVAAVSSANFEYAGEAATVAGWLAMASAAIVSLGRLSSAAVRPMRFLLLGVTAVSIGLAAAAGLGLAESVVILDWLRRGVGESSYVSLLTSLGQSSAGVEMAAWIAATLGAAFSLSRARSGTGTAVARFTVALDLVLIAGAAQAAAGVISFVSDWFPNHLGTGWMYAVLALQLAGWFFFSVALCGVVAIAHRDHDLRWIVALSAGALGPLLVASAWMLDIAGYARWVGISGYAVLSHWEWWLLASGWFVSAIGSAMFAFAVSGAPRPTRIRAEDQPRWWIREALSKGAGSQLVGD